MSNDTFTEVTHKSWFSRIAGAFAGIFFGLLFILGSIIMLFFNEGRAIKTEKALKLGAKTVVSINPNEIDPQNDGKLVHVTGFAKTDEILEDKEFNIKENAIRLKRIAEMYQWDENKSSKTKKNVGGGTTTETTYSYNKQWSSSLIKSSDFKKPDGHQNPSSMPYHSENYTAKDIWLGKFFIPQQLAGQINDFSDYSVTNLPPNKNAKLADGEIYFGANPSSPAIGDVKISYQIIKPLDVSIIAMQKGKSFEPFQTKYGKELNILYEGIYNADEMFSKELTQNTLLTWGLRIGGFILIAVGFMLIFKPLSVFADVIPFIGSIVSFGTGLISFIISLIISLFTIALGWIVYRPVLGIVLFVIAGTLGIWIILSMQKKKKI